MRGHDEPLPDDDHHHGHTPHESPWVVLVPLLLLALGAVAAGYCLRRAVHRRGQALNSGAPRSSPCRPTSAGRGQSVPAWVVWAPLAVTAIGFVAAWYVYIANEGMGARIAAEKGPLWTVPLQQVVLRRAVRRDVRARGARRWATCSGRAATRRSSTGSVPTGWPRCPALVGRAHRPGPDAAMSITTPSSCCWAWRPAHLRPVGLVE